MEKFLSFCICLMLELIGIFLVLFWCCMLGLYNFLFESSCSLSKILPISTAATFQLGFCLCIDLVMSCGYCIPWSYSVHQVPCDAEWKLRIQWKRLTRNVQEICPYFSHKVMDTVDQNFMEIQSLYAQSILYLFLAVYTYL